MELEEVYSRLERYGSAMRQCLSVLDGGAPQDPLVGQAFTALTQNFEALGDLTALVRSVAPDGSERLEAKLEELTRLNAVLAAAVGQDAERMLELMRRARDARRACQQALGEGRTGESCDIRA